MTSSAGRPAPPSRGILAVWWALAGATAVGAEGAAATAGKPCVNGTSREFKLLMPPNAKRAPLVITLHGHGQSAIA